MSPRGSLDNANILSQQEILLKLRERIVAFAASRLQRDAAEDLAQEVLILLHEKYPRVDRVDELLPLAMKILRFKMMAARRKAQRRGEYTQVPVDEMQIADGGMDPEADAERRETRERLIAALAQLGERCRRLFALKLEGKTFPEIQGILGAASINTVYTWDLRCRKQLQERMGGGEEGR
jgi:RNA polymerase sigma-70 factor (ECF subfamily)